jgi:Holliday junction resolvasome RuvABC endonuclease subunit
MNRALTKQRRVLAIDPTTKGFGFAVMEGPESLIDWGVKEVKDNKDACCLKQIANLIVHYEPDVIVVEDYAAKGCRRCQRVRLLIRDTFKLALEKKIKIHSVSRRAVRAAFSQFGAHTKHEIASAIVKRFPELAPRQPPYRKPWMSEDDRMSIFDAVALALTFFYFRGSSSPRVKAEV